MNKTLTSSRFFIILYLVRKERIFIMEIYDIIIIGGGPAGMTAALYACRQNRNTLLLEKDFFGGQASKSPHIENFPGFDGPVKS